MTGFNPQEFKEKVKRGNYNIKFERKVTRNPLIKATDRQKLLIEDLASNGGSITNAAKKVGYAPSTYNNPSQLTESKGFLALADAIGLTDDFLLTALTEDIENKPKNRHAELTLGFKVRGRLKDDAQTTNFTPATINIAVINNTDNITVVDSDVVK